MYRLTPLGSEGVLPLILLAIHVGILNDIQ